MSFLPILSDSMKVNQWKYKSSLAKCFTNANLIGKRSLRLTALSLRKYYIEDLTEVKVK